MKKNEKSGGTAASGQASKENANGGCPPTSCSASGIPSITRQKEALKAELQKAGLEKIRFVEKRVDPKDKDKIRESISAQSNIPKNQVYLDRNDIPVQLRECFEFVRG